MDKQERDRRRALIAFQIFIYGFLAANFAVQLWMWAHRHW